MKLYLVRTFDTSYLFTENEMRDFIEEELRKPDGLITTKDVMDALELEDINPNDEALKDLSGLSAKDLMGIIQKGRMTTVEYYEFSNYGYELTHKNNANEPFDYHLQRVVYEDLGHFKSKEEVQKFMETHKGLMNE